MMGGCWNEERRCDADGVYNINFLRGYDRVLLVFLHNLKIATQNIFKFIDLK